MDLLLEEFKVLKHQDEFVWTDSKFPFLCGGYGSGKTISLILRMLRMMQFNAGFKCVIAEPVYPMVKDVLQPTLEKVLDTLKFKYDYSASELKYRIYWRYGWGDILLRSAENWRRLAGLNLWGFFLDEADLMKDDSAWNMGLSRLREGNVFTASACSTPEGFGWCWEKWVDDQKDGYELIQASTEDNIFIPEEFIESLKQAYDEKLLKSYLHGNFTNLAKGSTYYCFSREKNVKKCKYNPSLPIHVGNDQNVDPMCSVLFQDYGEGEERIRIFDEVVMRHSGSQNELLTERMCREIIRRYPDCNQFNIYPDASSKARKTSSRRTDFQIMVDEFKGKGRVIIERRNPLVIDRVNLVNKAMDYTIVDPSCKAMIRDLEQVTNIEYTREINKTINKELTHISDALGYGLIKVIGIRKHNVRALQR